MPHLTSPAVDIRNAPSLLLSAASNKAVLAGGRDTTIHIDGHPYAVSADHPVTVELLFSDTGPDGHHVGGLVTLTLVADRITLDPAPEGLCMHHAHFGRICPDRAAAAGEDV